MTLQRFTRLLIVTPKTKVARWHRVVVACALCFTGVTVGCKPTARESPRPAESSEGSRNHDSGHPDSGETSRPEASMPSENARVPCAAPAGGVPGPEEICGHATAFAGLRPGPTEAEGQLLYFDPADNALESGRHRHRWNVQASETPIHFGTRRPTIVLEAGAVFTVCGAVVMEPKGVAAAAEPVEPIADEMPDLSQVLGDQWPGLCGPTSAADLIYAVGVRRGMLVDGLPRGPSPEADDRASRLIVGAGEKIADDSLARRMGLRDDGKGVTNEGLRGGLAAWLDSRDPGAWSVALEWIDDGEKDDETQLRFFQRIDSVRRSGGGAILCLWPGGEFRDGSTVEAAGRRASPDDASGSRETKDNSPASGAERAPDAAPGASQAGQPSPRGDRGLPGDHPGARTGDPEDIAQDGDGQGEVGPTHAAGNARVLDGKKADPGEIAEALEAGRRAIDRARAAQGRGDTAAAMRAVGSAISVLRPCASADTECRQALHTAIKIAESLDHGGARQPLGSDGPTSFE